MLKFVSIDCATNDVVCLLACYLYGGGDSGGAGDGVYLGSVALHSLYFRSLQLHTAALLPYYLPTVHTYYPTPTITFTK